MDEEYMSRVLLRLRPFVRDGVIRRSRLDRVLGALGVPADAVRTETERLLRIASIQIEEDLDRSVPPAGGRVERSEATLRPGPGVKGAGPRQTRGSAAPRHGSVNDNDASAIRAARSRIQLDRHLRRPANRLLTAEEEVGLAKLIRGREGRPLKAGGFGTLTGEARQAAEALYVHNLRLVHKIAQGYAADGMEYDDIVQHGAIGLVRAVELFDPDQGNKFSTYATWWIRQAITRGIANDSRIIRLPVHMVERIKKVWKTRDRLTVDGVPPTVRQLALNCDLDEEQVQDCIKLGRAEPTSLDVPVGADSETTLGDLLDRRSEEPDIEDIILMADLRETLGAILDTLSEREATILELRFGLDGGDERTLEQIGEFFGVTRERIRQLESKAMSKLRHPSRLDGLRPYAGKDGAPIVPVRSGKRALSNSA